MLSAFSNFKGLRSLAGAFLLAISTLAVLPGSASAGVLTYNSGTGGTFNPSSPSTFTFTNFVAGTLSSGVNYTDAKVLMRWGGTGPYPGAFDITGVSISSPTVSLGNVQFLSGTASGSFRGNDFVTLGTALTTTNLSSFTLTLTIPTLTVANGFYLEAAIQGTDNGVNTNATAFQKVTAVNSAAVPEPSAGLLAGGAIAACWFVKRRRSNRV